MHNNARVIRIALVDRQEILRNGLKRLLESEPGFVVVGGTDNARQALRLVRDLDPDILLLDMGLRGGESFEVLRALAPPLHSVRTIGLIGGVEKDMTKAALRSGACAVILKESATAQLFTSIRTVFEGKSLIRPGETAPVAGVMRELPPRTIEPPARRLTLTRRDMDIVSAVAAGESTKSIAQLLSISEDAVKHHVSRAFGKLSVLTGANDFGLTTAVPGRVVIHTDGRRRTIRLDNLTIEFRPMAPTTLYWAGRPAMRIVQALRWLEDTLPGERDRVLTRLSSVLAHPRYGKRLRDDLRTGLATLPAWMQDIVRDLLRTNRGRPLAAGRRRGARVSAKPSGKIETARLLVDWEDRRRPDLGPASRQQAIAPSPVHQ